MSKSKIKKSTKSKEAKRVRKPLTKEQRNRKNMRARERRRIAREAENKDVVDTKKKAVKKCAGSEMCRSEKTGISCTGCSKKSCCSSRRSGTCVHVGTTAITEELLELVSGILSGSVNPMDLDGEIVVELAPGSRVHKRIPVPGGILDVAIINAEAQKLKNVITEDSISSEISELVDRNAGR